MKTSAERELNRWLIALGTPLLVAAVSVSVAFATSGGAGWTDWFFAPAVLLAPAWITSLAFLALHSDTNGSSAETIAAPVEELRRPETSLRKAA
jgi:hypothetical protein